MTTAGTGGPRHFFPVRKPSHDLSSSSSSIAADVDHQSRSAGGRHTFTAAASLHHNRYYSSLCLSDIVSMFATSHKSVSQAGTASPPRRAQCKEAFRIVGAAVCRVTGVWKWRACDVLGRSISAGYKRSFRSFSRLYCCTQSAVGIILSSVCLSVCDAVHCG